ncbi:hypothetical protein GUITHDRAFT_143080 [Guillardia theta CCMP2712]|uniref:Uncharacterized protein n=1 Tax=Guillardia theta (strain CCMP2712) TaxID=905079 RepID=L1IUK1_GUITC|nr:hypothetical protein GUITHDRAFT_143080 [Guillardia theta CCMP2712]EKX39903.1 hypothetical protein GUITHDRAFT_143080 [Guillardia theta CCMP2712]|eukprot:XP_005826883.1 hypothetical protein GUITHDRAFT_143080 [Guillardia theta CCMP2712]
MEPGYMSAWGDLPDIVSPPLHAADSLPIASTVSTPRIPLKSSRGVGTARCRKLAVDTAVRIFRERMTLDAKSKFVESELVGRMYGVNSKTVRDIWDRRSWAKQTEFLVVHNKAAETGQQDREEGDNGTQGVACCEIEQPVSIVSSPLSKSEIEGYSTHSQVLEMKDSIFVFEPSWEATASSIESVEMWTAGKEDHVVKAMEYAEEFGSTPEDLSDWNRALSTSDQQEGVASTDRKLLQWIPFRGRRRMQGDYGGHDRCVIPVCTTIKIVRIFLRHVSSPPEKELDLAIFEADIQRGHRWRKITRAIKEVDTCRS